MIVFVVPVDCFAGRMSITWAYASLALIGHFFCVANVSQLVSLSSFLMAEATRGYNTLSIHYVSILFFVPTNPV